ncbi:GTPase domain-containing protein [Aeromicrobium sp. Sec7.5]|uniref:GTPase domain-containing protein n=1 Tax=Aeromicrobium sp. Sec7.5 TaxID=3121276 RepID=UPI002FE4A389
MVGVDAPGELLGALSTLLDRVRHAELPLATEDVEGARRLQAGVADQLSDYVLPRLVQLDAPVLVVVGGSTGAGKSTLVNSIVGEVVSESGVLRPTTRSPVLTHHPDDGAWFQADRVLPDLPRTDVPGNSTYGLRLRASSKVPKGLAILDAPDVDSIDEGNRVLAAQLLAAADLWLFVTSAARYADQVPWDYLRQASERSTSVAVVLDRTARDGIVEVRSHLARMMTSRGLSDSPLFTVPETSVDTDGLLPADAVKPIVDWLHDLASNDETRALIVRSTLDGAVRHNVLRSHDLADAYDSQVRAADKLRTAVDDTFAESERAVRAALTDGGLVSGDVAARWQSFVGTGEMLRSVEGKVGRIRERLVDGVTGKRSKADDVAAAIEHDLAVMLVERAESSATVVVAQWASVPAGEALVAARPGLDRAPRDLRARAERVARDWQQQVTEQVRLAVADRRLSTDVLAIGVPGLAVSVMITALGAGGTDAGRISRRVLDAVLSSDVVDRLAAEALSALEIQVVRLAREERARFAALSPDPDLVRESQKTLRDAARRAEYARHLDDLETRVVRGTHSTGQGGTGS